jgi:hypothetical protein
MTFKHFLLVGLLLAAVLLSFCHARASWFNERRKTGHTSKRTLALRHHAFSPTFDTFDVNGDGVITLEEFLKIQPGHEQLFYRADTNKDGLVNCLELAHELLKFNAQAIC